MNVKNFFPQALICIVFLISSSCTRSAEALVNTAGPTVVPGDSERTISVNGLERTYLLHVPAGLSNQKPVPLVFLFHGLSESASLMSIMTDFNSVSDSKGFLAVYPNGTGSSGSLSWNAGGCCGYALENNVDDRAFVRQMIADLGAIFPIDAKRIYATGFSNGGLLSYRLACEMSDIFAAIAPVAGARFINPCEPAQQISVIAVHGRLDNLVPYAGGGVIPGSGQPFPSVEESLASFIKLDGCTASPRVTKDGIVTHTVYPDCRGGAGIEIYLVDGNGHAWPPSSLFPASSVIWDFFSAHPKP